MLKNISLLIEAIEAGGVRYCHWKSNAALSEGLAGLTDLDLLVDRKDANAFRGVLSRCGFQPAAKADGSSFPSTEHYFGLDCDTGVLVHIHAYYKVISGESLAKNFRLPLEDMLLQNTRRQGPIRVPAKGAELVVFVVRVMLKHTAVVELAFLARDWERVARELEWLVDADSVIESIQLVSEWLPTVGTILYVQCLEALQGPAPLPHRLVLGRRVRSRLRIFARHSGLRAFWIGLSSFAQMVTARLALRPRGLVLRSGGAVLAFIGAEAVGKSTLISEGVRWLGEHFVVERVHAGKPPSTILTLLPNAIVPLMRVAMRSRRPSELEARHAPAKGEKPATWVYPLSFAVRSVLLAYDRRALLAGAFARAANGAIVFCDRYPLPGPGAADGPQLMRYPLPAGRHPVRKMLADIEQRLYRQIPDPDLTISLTLPVEVAIARNRTRGKYEPEEYVRRRHSAAGSITRDNSAGCSIDTDRPLDETLRDVKRSIWSAL